IDSLKKDGGPGSADQIADLQDKLTSVHPFDKAVRSVFASVWGEKPFLFRDYYRLPHMKVSMGILVHPSFVDEIANGVVLIKMKNGTLGADVVAQTEDYSITNPEIPGALPDRFLAEGSTVTQTLMHSSLTGGRPVLSAGQIQSLLAQLAT